MSFKPHQYQLDAIRWILEKPAAGLYLPPGLGKTAIMLSAMSVLMKHKVIDKVLVIAPLRVCYNVWPNEIQKWSEFNHLKCEVLHNIHKDAGRIKNADVIIINPEGLPWLARNVPSMKADKLNWALICDESTLFKNHTSQRFKTLKRMLSLFKRRYILTGTPVPNGLLQIWSQIFILDVGQRLSTYITHFRNEYFIPVGWNGYGYEIKSDGEKRIYKAIDDIVMHKSQDELDLPPVVYNYINVELPSDVMKQYKKMKNDLVAELNGEEVLAFNAAVKGQKLKQIANGCAYNEYKEAINVHNEKLDVVKDIVEELSGRPLLVVYEHVCDLEKLKAALPDAKYIGGGSRDDSKTIEQWGKGELPVLLLQPKAGGHGLNLQDAGCHDIVWYSIPFDLELYIQANKRVHRQGIKNSVTIHHIIAKNTIDEQIIKVLEGKATLQDSLLEAMRK